MGPIGSLGNLNEHLKIQHGAVPVRRGKVSPKPSEDMIERLPHNPSEYRQFGILEKPWTCPNPRNRMTVFCPAFKSWQALVIHIGKTHDEADRDRVTSRFHGCGKLGHNSAARDQHERDEHEYDDITDCEEILCSLIGCDEALDGFASFKERTRHEKELHPDAKPCLSSK